MRTGIIAIIILLLMLVLRLLYEKYYKDGKGFAAYKRGDFKTAFRELKASAEQGDTKGQYNFGVMLANEEGVTRDYINYKEALKWYQKAAEKGFARAQYNLGAMYFNGQGVSKDYVLSYMWVHRADLGGFVNAKGALSELKAEMTPEQIAEVKKF